MANPTGTQNLTENTGYVWTDGDVYEIPQTDTVEGAATGASFSGLGVDNEPHQILLNKAKLLRTNQVVDEGNISTLLAFAARFTCSLNANGYLKLGAQDVTRGAVQPIIQWGTISLLGATQLSLRNTMWTQNFPLAFPNAIIGLVPYWQSNETTNGSEGAFAGGMMNLEAITPLSLTVAQVFSDWDDSAIIRVAGNTADGKGLTGIGWIAWGF